MSNLNAHEWSELTVKKLRQFEDKCEDEDLFCVGYLIPLVEIVELENKSEQLSLQVWHDRYLGYVSDCLATDAIVDNDATRIQAIVASLANA